MIAILAIHIKWLSPISLDSRTTYLSISQVCRVKVMGMMSFLVVMAQLILYLLKNLLIKSTETKYMRHIQLLVSVEILSWLPSKIFHDFLLTQGQTAPVHKSVLPFFSVFINGQKVNLADGSENLTSTPMAELWLLLFYHNFWFTTESNTLQSKSGNDVFRIRPKEDRENPLALYIGLKFQSSWLMNSIDTLHSDGLSVNWSCLLFQILVNVHWSRKPLMLFSLCFMENDFSSRKLMN